MGQFADSERYLCTAYPSPTGLDLSRHRQQRSWYGLEAREVDRIVELLEQNLREEPQSDTNLRLWVQAVRRAKIAPTTEAVIERVGYWRSNANSLDSVFCSYVFHAQSIEGSALALDQANRFIEECRNRTRFNRNRTKSLEWLGRGSGITRLVHHSQLGNWDRTKDFWENTSLDTVEVWGSSPHEPTIVFNHLDGSVRKLHL